MEQPRPAVLDWLVAADPSTAWQTLRDLRDRPASVWRPVRARVATTGWGAALLAAQDPDGRWGGGVFAPEHWTEADWAARDQPWTTTSHVLTELRRLGVEPDTAWAHRTVELLTRNADWGEWGTRFWEGEVEACINGRLLADGAYFGVDMARLAGRLVGETRAEGGWNCEPASDRASIDSTVNVLEGLLEFELAGGHVAGGRDARRGGEEFLLARGLFRRLSTGEVADPGYLLLTDEPRWRHDVLRGLEHMRRASIADGTAPDPRLAPAVEAVRSLRGDDGRWSVGRRPAGDAWVHVGSIGDPSPLITLHALRVLRWWDEAVS